MMLEQITNRLRKNFKHKSKWAKRNSIEAFRLYDMDIPDFPFIADIYKDYIILYFKGDDEIDAEKGHDLLIMQALIDVTGTPKERIIYKKRYIQDAENKYDKLTAWNASDDIELVIKEGNLNFKVNLTKYIDTGLFLDHRPLRGMLQNHSKDLTVLNLFCYTGSLSIACALTAQRVTSVDMSNTYLTWAQENFKLNNIDTTKHEFVRADVFSYLNECTEKFDMIIIDPPSFSVSKKMENTLDIQRDQEELLTNCFNRLNRGGVIYFSNNLRKFKISPKLCDTFDVKDLTKWSIPEDFHDQKIHHLFELSRR